MDTTQTLKLMHLLTTAAKQGASDLHFNVGSLPMVRVDGALKPMDGEEVLSQEFIKEAVSALLSTVQVQLLETNREITFTNVFDNKIRAKVNIYYQEGVLSLSLRFLSLHVKTLQELNVPDSIQQLAAIKRGLIVVAGGYGSGRTTLAMAMLEQINRTRAEHIMSIERPREYDLSGNKSIVDQREVGTDVGSFEQALDYVQKEDIDVLLVSELSSPAIVRRVLDIANAGILVIVIMDAESSVRAIEKIVTAFEPHEQGHILGLVADALVGVVTQKIVPRMGGGVAFVHEVLLSNQTVKTFIASNRLSQIASIIPGAHEEGMISLDHELAMLVKNREVLPEVARGIAMDKEVFDRLIKG